MLKVQEESSETIEVNEIPFPVTTRLRCTESVYIGKNITLFLNCRRAFR